MSSLLQPCLVFVLLACSEKAMTASVSAPEEVVVFSAGLSNTQYFAAGDTVIYDKVFTNEKWGYSPNTGVFTCPVPGIYMFQFHGYSTNNNAVMWLDLHHNDQITVSVSGYNAHTVGSNSVILNLHSGDRVQVKSRDQQAFSLFGIQDQIYSTFNGFLISSNPNRVYSDVGSPLVG